MSQLQPLSDVSAERMHYARLAEQTRIEYAHYARLAELYAYRYAQARARRRYTAAVGSERNYRQAAHRCHVLGELMRGNASSHRGINGSARLPVAELAQAAREVMRGRQAA